MKCYCSEIDATWFNWSGDHCSGTNVMAPGRSGLVEENAHSAEGRFVVSDTSVGNCILQGNVLVTFVVISIPIACSNYPCSFTFRMFVDSYLLLDAYNHSKQTLDFMQTTTVKIVKRKKLVF